MEKKVNLSISILYVIQAICCFFPFCLYEKYWVYEESLTYHGRSALKNQFGISIFGLRSHVGQFIAVLFIITMLVAAVLFLLKVFEIAYEVTDYAWIVPIVSTVLMIIYLIYSCGIVKVESVSNYFDYSINWMFFIVIVANVISLLLALLLKFDVINNLQMKLPESSPKIQKTAKLSNKESIDDLVKYKELLDIGAITSDEFDKKKKEILEL